LYLEHVLGIFDSYNGARFLALRNRLILLLVSVHSSPPDPTSPSTLPVSFSGNSNVKYEPFIYEGQYYSLRGSPSYSLWYGAGPCQDLEVNSITVEMREGEASHGVPQCLAYMSMIQSRRAVEKKMKHRVFGLSTDGEQFHFLEIDGERQVGRSRLACIMRL
jgi:hypothetical protein